MYTAGESFFDISKKYSCSKNTIRSALIDAGIETNVGRSISLKMVGRPSPRKGKNHTEETKAKLRLLDRTKWNTTKGRKHSRETLLKISAATKGKNTKYTDEERKLIVYSRALMKRLVRSTLLASGKRKSIFLFI